MKRKVIQIAGSTQLVSLPRKWALKQGIKKGDEIDVLEEGERIIISTNLKHEVKKKVLEVKKIDNLLRRVLSALYKSGYEEVELRFDNLSASDKISEDLKKHMLGFEILDQSSSHCLIKSISEEQPSEFEPSLRRLFLITNTMAKNVLDTLKNPGKISATQYLVLEQTNNRLANFCERLLNRKINLSSKDSNNLYTIVWELEKIADELKYLLQYIEENKIKNVSKDIISNFEKTVEMMEKFYEVFYRYDYQLLERINEIRKDIIEFCNHAFKTKKSHELKIIHHMINIVQMTYNITGCYISYKS